MISIDRLRVANILFTERDFYEDAFIECKSIVRIKDVTIATQDHTITTMESKVMNLNLIIDNKNRILELEEDKLLALRKKYHKEKSFIIGSAGIMMLLLILL